MTWILSAVLLIWVCDVIRERRKRRKLPQFPASPCLHVSPDMPRDARARQIVERLAPYHRRMLETYADEICLAYGIDSDSESPERDAVFDAIGGSRTWPEALSEVEMWQQHKRGAKRCK